MAGSTQETWDDKAKKARSWDEYVGWIKEDVINEIERRNKEKEEKAQKELDAEIEALRKEGVIKTKADENAILEFALKKSEELGRNIPLSVAYAWMQETAKATGQETRKVASKVQTSRKSKGGPGKEAGEYRKDLHSKDLDEIVMEAKEKAPSEELS